MVLDYYDRLFEIIGVYLLTVIIFFVVMMLSLGLFFIGLKQGGAIGVMCDLIGAAGLGFFIYLAIGYMYSMLLVADGKVGAWRALKVSRKAVSQHWFKFFFTVILVEIVVIISILPLGIGLIWSLPWVTVVFGNLYKTLFGVEAARVG
jgi:uncharacterized membrane protein